MAADVGLIGLGVMGQNLVLNMHDHGYRVAVFNRTTARVDEFLAGPAAGTDVIGTHSVEELVAALDSPRRVMLMIKAGAAVDAAIDQLVPLLEPGDIIIDGGNSNFEDTIRRTQRLEAAGLRFIGAGISGGEEGARYGPSIMPGGSHEAWPFVKEIFQAIAAKVDDGTPCCDWVGGDGAGHYVKMVHNGIEYGDMQLIAEAYHLLSAGLGMDAAALADVFRRWDETELDSYLIEITAEILATRDEHGSPLVEKVLDAAGQKGTGKWTVVSSMHLGMPVTLVAEAVYARVLSALKDQRVTASQVLSGPKPQITADRERFVEDVRRALYASKIVSYAQGFMLMQEAAREYGWDLDYGGIALMWREGCIIRSAFLGDIKAAFDRDSHLANLLVDPYFADAVQESQPGWRRVVAAAIEAGIPVPAYSTALAFYDAYRTERLPANLIQAQRDSFGAHTYERIDRPRGEFFHSDWSAG